jgi:hypothetical protein
MQLFSGSNNDADAEENAQPLPWSSCAGIQQYLPHAIGESSNDKDCGIDRLAHYKPDIWTAFEKVQVTCPYPRCGGFILEVPKQAPSFRCDICRAIIGNPYFQATTSPNQVQIDVHHRAPNVNQVTRSAAQAATHIQRLMRGRSARQQLVQEQRQMVVTVPHGVQPGQQIQISAPNGQQMMVPIPNGLYAGQQFRVNLPASAPSTMHSPQPRVQVISQAQPQSQQMQLTVPQGVMPGQSMQFRVPDGRTLEVPVPQGCYPGSTFLVNV